ncbi:hypothetical protein [Frigoriglobus tundricola]|uniref:Uncharacterized protein n=1 Tax=Frigoriglobus tundricola TaxID=2774151 RepID=A0A6M5YQU3_9BACT|nr:hypothetical protein [Frigoriglobus tundricola]QJW95726.1 hypothetical protein FTUN_3280 [Frigoriglobus tundricola]
MKRFAIAAALATVLGLGLSGTAGAQYVGGYTTITPNGGVVSSNSIYNLGTYQSYNTYVSPFGTVRRSAYYTDVYGNSIGAAAGYNAFTGYGYNRAYYQPGPIVNPYPYYYNGYYNYGYGRRRW